MKYFLPAVTVFVLSTGSLFAQTDSTKQAPAEDDLIPTITATSDDLNETLSNQNVSSMLSSSRDIYAATASFRLTQAGFKYRGYRNDQFSTLINGILVNDPENGQSFWGGWGAFNEVLNNRSGNIGLAPSTHAFGGLGGSYNIDTRAGSQRKGLSISYAATNRTYNNRLAGSYSTGMLKGGWAVTLAFSRRWAVKGYEKGTNYDGYGYFFSAEKRFGTKHSLSLTAFGTPTTNARTATAVREMQTLANDVYYNPDWGYQNGQIRSSNVNKRFEPTFMLTHEAKFSSKTNLLSGVSFEFGQNRTSLIDYYNSASPLPGFYRNLPSFIEDPAQSALAAQILSSSEAARQIQWDNLYAINRSQPNTANGKQSSYVMADNVQASKKVNFNTTLNHQFSDHVSLTAGLTYQWEKVRNFKELTDLMGGDYYTNLNNFAIQDFPTDPRVLQNDLLHPNRVIHVGDAYGYDYNSQIHKSSAWLQPYFKFNHVEFFVAGQLTHSYYWRTGNVESGLFPTNSLGDSKKISMITYAVKGGLQYKINGKNHLYLNAELKTETPTFNNSFLSLRTRNEEMANLKPETIYSGELGYQYKSSVLTFKLSAFYTQFTNITETRTFFHDDFRTNVNYSLTGIDRRHYGAELGLDAKIYKGLSASLVANIGRYQSSNNPSATVTKDNSSDVIANNVTSYLQNYYVGQMPQFSGSFGLKYRSKKYWYAGINFNYFDLMYVDVNPVRRTLDAVDNVTYGSALYNQILHQEQLKGQFTMDMNGGYSLLLNKYIKSMDKKDSKGVAHKYFINFYATLTNMTNNRGFITSGNEQLRYDYQEKNVNEFATKYRYMRGFGFYLSATFKMQ